MLKSKKEIANKVAGAFYGFAIGDAMGATTEFMNAKEIRSQYGTVKNIIGGGWLKLKPGQVTDDTEMMLCVAEGYMANHDSTSKFEKEVSNRFIKWYKGDIVDCGNACASAIEKMMLKVKPRYDDKLLGNGALMRALPMAIVDNIELNLAQTNLTHFNRFQHYFVTQYHDMVVRQIYGKDYGIGIGWNSDGYFTDIGLPTGHVANTLYHAVMNNLTAYNFEQVIIRSVNNGGDADTIAAIAGGLAGATYGFESIPSKWIDQLDQNVTERIDNVVNAFVQYAIEAYNKKHMGGAK